MTGFREQEELLLDPAAAAVIVVTKEEFIDEEMLVPVPLPPDCETEVTPQVA